MNIIADPINSIVPQRTQTDGTI